MVFPEKELPKNKEMKPKFRVGQKTRIISGRNKKKKYYDRFGAELNDPHLVADIERGATVISYREEKTGTEYHS